MASEAPSTFRELRVLLQRRFPGFADGQQRIARLVLDDPEGTAFRSIGESAVLARVHRSSLVRFATMLGLSGYPDLVRLCRQQLAAEAHVLRERAAEPTSREQFLTAVLEHDTANVARAFDRIDRDDWDRAVHAVASAETVHVVGLRVSLSVAYQVAYLLRAIRPGVRQIKAAAGLLVDELGDIGAGDALVAVSIHRYARETVQAVEWARRRGATTIAFTDGPSSPLARIADLTFYAETGGLTELPSLTALTSVAQALAFAVEQRLGSGRRSKLTPDEQLLEEFAVYEDHRARGI
ncbi:MurR/RpiR family transcriptional regulator [Nocardia barduliensis]|uniref:MurR/RpiR family transcriptional regulator n=1 Tax=Nocardia barduliensis TaxID=2736643 RepID=UPI001571725B|nr:MurR/RpiR family transcriptional regulator [Nocardia barduliensis]